MPKPSLVLNACVLVAAMLGGIACVEAARSDSEKGPPSDLAAHIGDKPITLKEVDERAIANSVKAYQALYDARHRALEQMISDQLLDLEAKARGITADQLIKDEISSKAGEVSDADVEAYFNKNKARMRGKTLEQSSAQVRSYLTSQGLKTAKQNFINDLKKKNKVQIYLDPPRMEVTIAENDAMMGPADAKVTIVEFSDFQ